MALMLAEKENAIKSELRANGNDFSFGNVGNKVLWGTQNHVPKTEAFVYMH